MAGTAPSREDQSAPTRRTNSSRIEPDDHTETRLRLQIGGVGSVGSFVGSCSAEFFLRFAFFAGAFA